MKLKIYLCLLAGLMVTTGHAQSNELLIREFLDSPQLAAHKSHGKLFVLNASFCANYDCDIFFKDHSDAIEVHAIEGLFARAIFKYLVLDTIDADNGIISGKMVDRQKMKPFQISLD